MKFLKITDKDGDFISYYNLDNIIELTKYEDYEKGSDATEDDYRIQFTLTNGETISASTVTTYIEIVEEISLHEKFK